MIASIRLHHFIIFVAACGSSASGQPDSSTATTAIAACQSVGTSMCAQMFACYTESERTGFGITGTEADCVAAQNAHCTDAAPSPGYCKGHPQASADVATGCANELSAMTCAMFKQPTSSGVCKTQLCSP
jgi:hypothetical protein